MSGVKKVRVRRGAARASSGGVVYEQRGRATVVRLDRPERRNAIDGATAAALHEAFQRFVADDAARVLVLTGDEVSFCAGADLKAVETLRDRAGGPLGFTRLHSPKPTIAAANIIGRKPGGVAMMIMSTPELITFL